MFGTRHLLALLVATILLSQFTVAWADEPAIFRQFQIADRWQGKFPLPDDNSITDAENPIAVEIIVRHDAAGISGTVVFYVIRNKDNKPQVVGKKESEMLAPQFDGKMLKFGLKMKGAQPGSEATVEMRMLLKTDSDAELENHDDASAAVFK